MNSEYLTEIRKLSLSARSAVGLIVVEEYFNHKGLVNSDTDDYLNHLWEWPLVTDFDSWEKRRPLLVNYSLGDEVSSTLRAHLSANNVNEVNFRKVVSGPVEVLWSSFWGAAEDEFSYNALVETIGASALAKLPVLTPFKFSLFEKENGWGEKITRADRDFWRQNAKLT